MQFSADTLDDILQTVLRKILKSKIRTKSTKGSARELMASVLTIKNPRARFSRTENRATLFSCLGETLWYLSGSDKLNVIEYYIPSYRHFSDLPDYAQAAPGAYGPRMFEPAGSSQMATVLDILKRKNDTRQAVMQIFRASDLTGEGKDVPCTCTLQFLARRGALHTVTNMRSNDAYRGLPHDVFAFTIIQELVARSIDHEIGTYNHIVSSLHLYDRDEDQARKYLAEGWQEKYAMPPMPKGEPWSALAWLQQVEKSIRLGSREPLIVDGVDPYWADLARLLRIKALLADRAGREVIKEEQSMSSDVYKAFIHGKERQRRIKPSDRQLSFPAVPSTPAAS